MNNRAFSKIWVIIVLIILAGGGIFAWQQWGTPKDETAKWQTYRNEDYGFEIKYSQKWFVEKENTEEIIFGKGLGLPFIDIKKFTIPKNKTFKEILVENTTLGESPNHPDFNMFELRQLGQESFYYIFPYLSEGRYSTSYWFVKEPVLIRFTLIDDATSNWFEPDFDVENQPSYMELNQILSTFRFLE